MSTVTVDLGERSYSIDILCGALGHPDLLTPLIKGDKVVVVTNDIVKPLYLQALLDLLNDYAVEVICLPDGEQHKSLEQFESIMTQLLTFKASRDTTLIALGGGVVGDITGFCAACFQRGVPFIQIPTTLLSQVDSSVGGKTAVNHPLGKNMIGAFYQPQLVLVDINTLDTLPAREFSAGMAEVIKYGIIYSEDFFNWLECHVESLQQRSKKHLTYVVTRCCQIKADIVSKDEKEQGLRALLNLGHTFGHAIESEQGYGNWLHGEAVACGMVIAARVAQHKQWLSNPQLARIIKLIEAFDLPVNPPEHMTYDTFLSHMQLDKKVLSGRIRFIIPKGIGRAVVTDEVEPSLLRSLLG